MEINELYCRKPNRRGKKRLAFEVWYNYLFMIVANMFIYENLPANLPQWEIEKRLILTGYALIFDTEKYGIVTATGSRYGVGIYDYGNKFTAAQSVLGSIQGLTDNVDGVIMYASSPDRQRGSGVMGQSIALYADLLSDIDISIGVSVINNRAVNTIGAKTDSALTALKEYQQRLYDGDPIIPKLTGGLFDSTENILKIDTTTPNGLSELTNTQTALLKRFYNSFGIPFIEKKAERLIDSEVDTDKECLSVNMQDYLNNRIDGVNHINALFNTNIIVRVNNNVLT